MFQPFYFGSNLKNNLSPYRFPRDTLVCGPRSGLEHTKPSRAISGRNVYSVGIFKLGANAYFENMRHNDMEMTMRQLSEI